MPQVLARNKSYDCRIGKRFFQFIFLTVCFRRLVNAGSDYSYDVTWLSQVSEQIVIDQQFREWDFWPGITDSFVMTGMNSSIRNHEGSDAVVVFKAAGGVNGLYVYYRIHERDISRNDFATTYHDPNSSAWIDTCSVCSPMFGFLYTSKAFEVLMVGDTSYDYVVPWSHEAWWCGLCPDFYTFTRGYQVLGVVASRITIDSGIVVQYRLPWALLSATKVGFRYPPDSNANIVPARGTLSAFAIDYHDVDTVGSDTGWIAWKRSSAWIPDSTNSYRYWGDLIFGPGFPEVATPAESLLAVAPRSRHSGHTRGAAGNVNTSRFTLTGRRTVESGSADKPRGVQVLAGEGGRRIMEIGW